MKKNKTADSDMINIELCKNCDECCHYIALEIDRPTTKSDIDNIRWYLLHKNVYVYIDWDNDWFVEFITPCLKLKNKLCDYYQKRPNICRDYKQTDCTHYNNEPAEKIYFKSIEDFNKYLIKKSKSKLKKSLNKKN